MGGFLVWKMEPIASKSKYPKYFWNKSDSNDDLNNR